MSTLELKRNLKRRIDSIPPRKFKKIYGEVINTLNQESEIDEWSSLSDAEKKAIDIGLKQADLGKTKSHKQVMSRLFAKYGQEDKK
jgi:predicted transcriptional regulator